MEHLGSDGGAREGDAALASAALTEVETTYTILYYTILYYAIHYIMSYRIYTLLYTIYQRATSTPRPPLSRSSAINKNHIIMIVAVIIATIIVDY